MIVYQICRREYDSYNRPQWDYSGDLYLYEEDAQREVTRLTDSSNDGYKRAFTSNLKLWAKRDMEELALIKAGLRQPRTKPFYYKLTIPTDAPYKYEPIEVIEHNTFSGA